MSVQVIINAAGMGTRLGMGNKALIEIAGKPLIHHQIAAIRSVAPESKILLVVGHQAKEVGQATGEFEDVHLVFNPHFDCRGIVESVYRAVHSGHFNAMQPTLRLDGDLLITDPTCIQAMCKSSVSRIAMQSRLQPAYTPEIKIINGVMHSIRLVQDYVGDHEWPCVEFYMPMHMTHMMSYAESFKRRHYYELINHFNAVIMRRDRMPAFSICPVHGIKEIDNATDLRLAQEFVRGREHILDFTHRVPAVSKDAGTSVPRLDVAGTTNQE